MIDLTQAGASRAPMKHPWAQWSRSYGTIKIIRLFYKFYQVIKGYQPKEEATVSASYFSFGLRNIKKDKPEHLKEKESKSGLYSQEVRIILRPPKESQVLPGEINGRAHLEAHTWDVF